jgi:ferredoxin
MRIVIDKELCTGHARCVELLPSVFQLGADGFGEVRAEYPQPAQADLERVIALCPELAISVQDD